MHKKVMLEFPDGKRRWGYATTEIPEPSDIPYITMGKRPVDGYTCIITSDTELAELLRSHGYQVDGKQTIATGMALPVALFEKVKADAERQNRKINSVVTQILEEYYNGKTD